MLPSSPAPLTEWTPVQPESPRTPVRPAEPPVRPRGTPLTDTLAFLDPGGAPWVAYIEGTPAPERGLFGSRAVMPGRLLRFDSPSASRATDVVPAGAPFLSPARLAALLAEAGPFPPPPVAPPPSLAERLWAAVARTWSRLAPEMRARTRQLQLATAAAGRALHAAWPGRHGVFR